MEKLAYLLIGPSSADPGALGTSARDESAAAMRRLGAHSVQLDVVEAELGSPFGVDPGPDDDQILAAAFAWVDAADSTKVSTALPEPPAGAQWHGWLVCEAEPKPNRNRAPGPDGRLPGFAQIVALSRPSHLTWGEWRRLWQVSHTPVAVNTQDCFRYVQNVVLRPLTAGAPGYSGIEETCFPREAAGDLHAFFGAVGDDARLARHMAAVAESCDRFMDGVAPVSWMTEWLF